MTRREVLFLCHRIPYPPDKGDKIRSWRIFEHLTKRFDVHLAAFVDDAADFLHEAFLRSRAASVSLVPLDPRIARLRSGRSILAGEPLSFGYYDDARMRAAVAAARRRPLVAEVVFSSSMAPYVEPPTNAPRLIDLCDADSAKWRQYADEHRGPMRWIYAREARRLSAAETRIINGFDAAFAVSKAEAAILASAPGIVRPVDWFGNGVDTDQFDPAACPEREASDVVFIGAMDYPPNIDAVRWFVAEVWPGVRAARPGARFAIVGARPTAEVTALGERDGVVVTGRVPDVRPWLHGARIAVAPLRIARGVQNKVLEAMAAAKPLVASTFAVEGVDAAPGRCFAVADDPVRFRDEVLRLLADPAAGAALGAEARATMIAAYSWPTQLARFDAALGRLGLIG